MLVSPSPPLAFGPFTSGWMLLWGLAAVVPLVLHFLYRRRQRIVPWAAMQFLAAAIQTHARRLRLWQWLLLLLRLLAIAMITLAVADPILRQSTISTAVAPASGLQVLVLDTSFSMRTSLPSAAESSRWQRAQAAALEQLEAAPSGDAFLVVTLGEPPLPIIARPTFDRASVQQTIASLKPSFQAADLPATLDVLATLIADARQRERLAGPLTVTFFSDLQQATWQRVGDRTTAARWQPLPPEATVSVFDVTASEAAPAESATPNVAVTELRIEPPVVFAGQPVVIEASVTLSGTLPESQRPVTFRVDGKRRSTQSVSWATPGTQTVTWTTRLAAGERTVTVAAGSDRLPIDNERSVVLDIPERLRVLCIGQPAATRYLAAAVTAGRRDWVETREVSVAQIGQVRDESFDVITLVDVAAPSTRLLRWLEKSTAEGTGLLWWLGAEADPVTYAALPEPLAARLLPTRLVDVAPRQAYPIDPRDYDHPITAAFRDFPQAGLLSTPLFRFWRTAPRGDTGPAPQLVLGAGPESEPLLLAYAWPDQRIAVVTTAPAAPPPAEDAAGRDEAPWNALVAWPSFVPLVQETVQWLAAGKWGLRRYQVGETVTGLVADQEAAVEQVESVEGDDVAVTLRRQDDGRWRWVTAPLPAPGRYRLRRPTGPDQRIAVNLGASESDLTSSPTALFRRAVTDQEASLGTGLRQTGEPAGGLFRWLLWAALGVLLGEAWVSRTLAGWR